MMNVKLEVDKYLNMKIKAILVVLKKWTTEMNEYFNKAWTADREKEKVDKGKGMEDFSEDVYEDESVAASFLVADELVGPSSSVLN